jgi:hypothetical protein
LQPKWHYTVSFGLGSTYKFPVNITTQNSYTFLQTVLGARSTSGDLANVADKTAVDASYADGGMWTATPGFNLTAYVQRSGDFDVFALTTPASQWVQIDLKRIAGSSVDPVLMIFDSTGRNLLAFNDDGGGYPNSRLVFGTTAGQSYRIVVGSYGANSTGGYQLTVNNYTSVLAPITTLQAASLYIVAGSNTGGGSGAGSRLGAAFGSAAVTQQSAALDAAFIQSPVRGQADNALGNLNTSFALQVRGGARVHSVAMSQFLQSPLNTIW